MLFDLQNQNYLIFTFTTVIVIFTMKKNPYSPHAMIAHCRFCDNHFDFQLKPNDNDLMSTKDLEAYSTSCADEYCNLKSIRLHYRLKHLSSRDKDVAKFFLNNPHLPLVISKNCEKSSLRLVYYFDDSFPIKKLKRLFSSLKINLISKKEGGQDE